MGAVNTVGSWLRLAVCAGALTLISACTNGDETYEVRFVSAAQTAAETAGTAAVVVQVDPAPASGLEVLYSVTGTASVGDDATLGPARLTIPAGATRAAIPVSLIDDATLEDDETLVFKLLYAGNDARIGNPSTHTVTIADDESAPTLSTVRFTTLGQSAAESAGDISVGISITPAATAAITLPISVGGTAGAADRSVSSSSLTIPAGATSATLVVSLSDDAEVEGDETVELTLGTPSGAVLGTPDTHLLTITDNDVPPPVSVVAFSAATSSRAEAAGLVNIAVTISPVSGSAITLPYTIGGTAGGADRSIAASPLTIAAGATSANIAVTLNDDADDETDETVILTLGAPTGAVLGTTTVHTLTIADDDVSGPPTVRFAAASATAAEDAGAIQVVVQVSPVAASDITVNYAVGGTAINGTDYSVTSSPLVIPAGSSSAAIVVSTFEDTDDEPNETVVLTLDTPAGGGAVLGVPSEHTLTLDDNDLPPAVPVVAFVSVASASLESAGAVNIEVSVSPTSPTAITVPFTFGGSAVVDSDYTPGASPLTIPANASNASITVGLLNDSGPEGNETITVTLGAPGAGATLGTPATHTLTIEDDEGVAAPSGTLFMFTDEYQLLRFSAAAPNNATGVPVTGVIRRADDSSPNPMALEFRPATGELYLYTDDRRFYVIDPVTGVATLRGTTVAGEVSTENLFAIDFDPCTDRIRALANDDTSYRLLPDATLLAADGVLSYATGDTNEGGNPAVDGVAYTACVGGRTTAYALDSERDVLVTLGSIDGTPRSASDSQLFTIGSFGISIGGAGQLSFDIDTVDNVGYTADSDGNNTVLYRVNLSTGALTGLGSVGNGPGRRSVAGLAVQP